MSLLLVPTMDEEGDKAYEEERRDDTDSDDSGTQSESTEAANNGTEVIGQQGEATTGTRPKEIKLEEPQPVETRLEEKKAEGMSLFPRNIFLFSGVFSEHLHLIPKSSCSLVIL